MFVLCVVLHLCFVSGDEAALEFTPDYLTVRVNLDLIFLASHFHHSVMLSHEHCLCSKE